MKHALLTCLLLSIGTTASAANSNTASAIAQKLNQLPAVQKMNMSEHITWVGQTSAGNTCYLTVTKTEDANDHNGSPISIVMGEGNFAIYNEGDSGMNFVTKEGERSKKYRYILDEASRSLTFSREYTRKTGWFSSEKYITGFKLDIDRDGSISSAIRQMDENGVRTALSCQNMKPLGMRKYDYNGGVNFGYGTDLLELCTFHYLSVCPNTLDYRNLPKSLEKLDACEELGKIGIVDWGEAAMCNEKRQKGNLR